MHIAPLRSLFMLVYLGTAAACYLPPGAPSLFGAASEGTSSLLLKHSWAPGFLLAAVASLNLRVGVGVGRWMGGVPEG